MATPNTFSLYSPKALKKDIQLKTTSLLTIAILLVQLTSASLADENAIVEEFNRSLTEHDPNVTRSSFRLENCLLEQFIVNVNYCLNTRQGSGDRSIKTTIDLAEVERITRFESDRGVLVTFEFDVGSTNRLLTLLNHFTMPKEEALQNFIERKQALIDQAELNSQRTSSVCGSTELGVEPQTDRLSITFREIPDNFENFLDYAQTCREPKNLQTE